MSFLSRETKLYATSVGSCAKILKTVVRGEYAVNINNPAETTEKYTIYGPGYTGNLSKDRLALKLVLSNKCFRSSNFYNSRWKQAHFISCGKPNMCFLLAIKTPKVSLVQSPRPSVYPILTTGRSVNN